MDHHDHVELPGTTVSHPGLLGLGEWLSVLILVSASVAYVIATWRLKRREIQWRRWRTLAWLAGCGSVGLALVGPIADRSHGDFTAHMIGHVLLGMLGPLLLVIAAPATLALRVLPVSRARRLARFLTSTPMAVLTNPFVAGLLNIGGLWLLYRTDLYATMHTETALQVLVHAHVLAAGYLFSFAVIGGPDPSPHRASPPWRAAALVLAIAGHNILAKSIYADPPTGVPLEQARAGAELMYYAGAPVEIALIFLVCRPWLLPRRSRNEPRRTLA